MASQSKEAQFIDIEDVRPGMYVHIDLGWLSHPFPLNSFKISSRDQIDTLIRLGVKRLRWSPEKSDLPETETTVAHAGQPPAVISDAAPGPPGATAGDTANPLPPAHGNHASATTLAENTSTTAASANGAPPALKAASAPGDERQRRRQRLDAQRASLELCEREFSSVARTYRRIFEQARSQPETARAAAQAMVSRMVENMLAQEETAIRLLSEAIGERASQHSVNVAVIAMLLGKTLGLPSDQLNTLGNGALLHDIGLSALPERLRWKDSQFSSSERRLYQEHVTHGVEIGRQMKLTADELAIIAQHHELADGHGYPQQLSGEQIALPARIVALVNLYDNLCNPGNPTRAITPHEALALIFAQMRHQFDSKVLMPFIRMMGVYPPGSVVELTDGRYALVVSVNAARPLKPSVIIYEPRIPKEEALVEDLEQAPTLGIRRSLKPLQLPKAVFDYLSPRTRICYFFERARDPLGIECCP